MITPYVNEKAKVYGIEVVQAVIENIGLPKEVEKLIDEQSGIGLAARDMDTFVQYQSAGQSEMLLSKKAVWQESVQVWRWEGPWRKILTRALISRQRRAQWNKMEMTRKFQKSRMREVLRINL